MFLFLQIFNWMGRFSNVIERARAAEVAATILFKKVPYYLTLEFLLALPHRVPTPPAPLPLRVAEAGKNQLNEEITPLLPTRILPNHISNFGHAAL
jgi:hypothetical protein